MSADPSLALPLPEPEIDDQAFWAAAAERRLLFQRCAVCGRWQHPPMPLCAACGSERLDWVAAPTRGRIFSFTVTHVAARPALKDRLPYNVALVAFADCGELRIITNIVEARPDELRIDADVELVWEAQGLGMYLPRFRLAADDATKETMP